MNGDIVDPSLVSVSVVHSNIRTVIDHIEMESPTESQKHSSSYGEAPGYYAEEKKEEDVDKPLLRAGNNSKELRPTTINGSHSSSSEDGHFNTQL